MSASGWLFFGTVIAAAIAAIATVIAAKYARSAQVKTATIAPYEALAGRVSRLEQQVAEQTSTIEGQRDQIRSLEQDASVLVTALTEQYTWQVEGALPPPPSITPPALALLRLHQVQRAETAD